MERLVHVGLLALVASELLFTSSGYTGAKATTSGRDICIKMTHKVHAHAIHENVHMHGILCTPMPQVQYRYGTMTRYHVDLRWFEAWDMAMLKPANYSDLNF